jgi:hypothetical protein
LKTKKKNDGAVMKEGGSKAGAPGENAKAPADKLSAGNAHSRRGRAPDLKKNVGVTNIRATLKA